MWITQLASSPKRGKRPLVKVKSLNCILLPATRHKRQNRCGGFSPDSYGIPSVTGLVHCAFYYWRNISTRYRCRILSGSKTIANTSCLCTCPSWRLVAVTNRAGNCDTRIRSWCNQSDAASAMYAQRIMNFAGPKSPNLHIQPIAPTHVENASAPTRRKEEKRRIIEASPTIRVMRPRVFM